MARQATGASKRMTISVPHEDIKEVEEFTKHYKDIKVSYSAQVIAFIYKDNQARRERQEKQ